MVLECDYPGCSHKTIVEDSSPGNYFPDEKILKAKGWMLALLQPEFFDDRWLVFCWECKDKPLPTDAERKLHHCIYQTYTKRGILSDRGSIRRCFICDGLDMEGT